jgi:hypothetical protein
MQEIVVAQSVVFVCGEWALAGELLLHCASLIPFQEVWSSNFLATKCDYGALHPRATEALAYFAGMAELRLSDPQPLISILQRVREVEASDPRDYCFAVLALSADADEITLRPDYGEHYSQTFRRYAIHLIEAGEGDRLLSDCATDGTESLIPSWVPRWDRALELESVFSYIYETVAAGGDSPCELSFADGATVLQARGLIAGHIVQSGSPVPFGSRQTTTSDEAIALVVRGGAELDKLPPFSKAAYPTGESLEHVKATTLTCGAGPSH